MQSSTPGYPLWSLSIVARLVGLRRSLVSFHDRENQRGGQVVPCGNGNPLALSQPVGQRLGTPSSASLAKSCCLRRPAGRDSRPARNDPATRIQASRDRNQVDCECSSVSGNSPGWFSRGSWAMTVHSTNFKPWLDVDGTERSGAGQARPRSSGTGRSCLVREPTPW